MKPFRQLFPRCHDADRTSWITLITFITLLAHGPGQSRLALSASRPNGSLRASLTLGAFGTRLSGFILRPSWTLRSHLALRSCRTRIALGPLQLSASGNCQEAETGKQC